MIVRVLISDDHFLICEGIQALLKKDSRYQVIGSCHNGKDTIDQVKQLSPDVLILDVELGDMNGLDVLRKLKNKTEETKVVILTIHDDKTIMLDAFESGAVGYLTKDLIRDELLEALDLICSGKKYTSSHLFKSGVERDDYLNSLKFTRKEIQNLTKSEVNVIKLINDGFTSKEIASHLFISPKTVENHRSNACKKLDLSGHNALVRWVSDHKNMIKTL